MINLFKKLFLFLIIFSLPLLVGCGDTGGGDQEVEYYLTPKTTEITMIRGEQVKIEYETNIEEPITFESFDEKMGEVENV